MSTTWTLAMKDLAVIGRDRTGLLFILCMPLIFAVFFGAMYGNNPMPQLSGGPTAFELSFPQGIVWGLLSVLMAFSTSLVSERSNGTLVRLQLAPIHKAQILGGKALACFLLNSAVMVLLLTLGARGFGVQPHSWALLLLALVCVSVSMTGLMMFLATFGNNGRTTQNIGWALMTLMAMAGGGMMPLVFMSDWLATLSQFSPIMWAVTALEGALWRGFDGAEMLRPCAVLLSIGAVAFSAGVARFKMHS